MNLVYFDEEEVYRTCRKLKSKFSMGPDGIPSVVYQKLAVYLAAPLAMIYCLMMQTRALPDIWKTAIVVPLYKKGPASNANNYRPISLTCVGCKIFETIVKTYVVSYLQRIKFFSKAQHGFLEKKSTTTNLLELMGDLCVNFNERASTLVGYIDFQKAFDKVSVPKLLYKIDILGIGGKLKSCLESF